MPKRSRKRGWTALAGWWFLLGVCGLYAAVLAVRPDVAVDALDRFGLLLARIVPVLVLVFVLLFLSDLFLERDWIRRHLGGKVGVAGWGMALAAGIVSMGPIYAWYPLLSELGRKGARTEFAAAFLYSRAIKLPLVPIIVHYFGLTYTIVLTAGLLVFSVASGLITAWLADIEPPDTGGDAAFGAGDR
jgi:uncharacterized membrane protein YraQ (UPF0718 family)